MQFKRFRDGNIATTQARNGVNMGSQGFAHATRAGENSFIRSRAERPVTVITNGAPHKDASVPYEIMMKVAVIVFINV
jgi:hypothetical protein